MSKDLDYLLVKSRRRKKTLSLQVRKDGAVIVQAPFHTSKGDIEKFLEDKERWLRQKLKEQKERKKECRAKSFKTGEEFLYLGRAYPLRVLDGPERNGEPLNLSGRGFTLAADRVPEGRELFAEWYRERAGAYIADRIRFYGYSLWMFPRSVRIGNAECRWGSCSYDDRLSFTWRLIMAPPPVIDYVILHELVHMKEKSHSPRFWNLLETLMPDYKKHRHWLRENGHLLSL